MDTLEVRLFGGVGAWLNGTSVGPFPTRWSAGLFAYLALNKGHPTHRDVLAARFWPEDADPRARKALRNALWRLRSVIEPEGIPQGSFLVVTRRNVCLERKSVWVDVEEFDGQVALFRREVEEETRRANLEDCIGLYRGDFMEGHDYEWCTYERERLRLALLTALEHLLEIHMQRREWHLALPVGYRILGQDPLREHVHRCLMVCYHLMGDRPLAIRQFRECERILDGEMGLRPMKETRELYTEIMAETLRRRLMEDGFPSITKTVVGSGWPPSRSKRSDSPVREVG